MTATLLTPESITPPAIATRRVLHVINGEHYSGAERVQDLLAQELPHCGFDVGFACVKPGRFPEARYCQTAALYRTPMRGRFDLRCGRELGKLIRREDFALVHAHTPRSLLAGMVAAREASVPLVYHVHSPTGKDSTHRIQNFINDRLERWLLRHAAKLIAVSPSLADLMVRQGFAPEKVIYVPNGVPIMKPISRQRPPKTWTLCMAALFRPRKGIEVLLEALALLRTQGRDVQLLAVGPFETSAYEHEVLSLVSRLGLTNTIEWTGFVSDVPAELSRADLFVLPSLFGEGLPMVVLEAMAASLPVIASNVEGIPAAIRDGQDGLLVEPNHPKQLAAAIGEIIASDSRFDYHSMCEKSHQQHATKFSATAMAQGVAQVYRDVLSA